MKKPLTAATSAGASRAAVPAPTAADPLAAGRSSYAQATRWMPYAYHDVLAAATRTAWWPRWLEIATAEPATLAAPGDRADGTLLIGRRPVQVQWNVARRLRDIVTLEATRNGDIVATLTFSFSNWYDGCAAELRLSSATGSSHRLRRALRRSLHDLGATVDPVGTAILCGAWEARSLPALGQAGR